MECKEYMMRYLKINYINKMDSTKIRYGQLERSRNNNPYIPVPKLSTMRPRTIKERQDIKKNTKANMAILGPAREAALANPPPLGKLGGKTRRRKGKKSRKTQKRR